MSPIPRRSLLKAAAVAGAAAQFSWALGARDAEAAPAAAADGADPVTLDWLEDGGLGAAPGATVGVPWPMGAHQADQSFAVTDAEGGHVPVQTWPLAYWPDGSLKWTAHAVATGTGKLTLTTGTPAEPARKVTVDTGGGTIDVSTGVITAKIGKNGSTLIKSVTRGSTEIARNGRLVLLRQPEIEDEDQGTVRTERFDGAVSAVTVEQDGPVRAVVRVDGKHRKGDREWLPFSLRLYFYAGSDSFRMVHTITYDGKQEPGKASGDFIRGLGVRFTVPMRDAAYDRHIRIGGEGTGLLREAVQGITGLRRDPGAAVQAAQYEGRKLPDPATWDQRVTTRLGYIPHWGDYTLARQAEAVRVLPQLAAPPEQLIKAKVFGPGLYSEPDRSTPAKARIEDHLDFLFTYYKDQVETRRWYGFWDYGDIMHTYDSARHVWRYDIGGYAWDNSELSPDLWLWYAYLRSGRSDIFRFAEAMTRHTGEVDVYHLGTWAGLGTRHGVQHFADSAKQQRIANTTYRRFYYFLTADERVGDLMHANVDSDETFLVLDPQRKVRTDPYTPDRHALSIGFGTDWSGLVSAWLTEWERKGPKWEKAKARVLSTMAGIAAQPNGFVQGSGLYDLDTGEFAVADKPAVSVSHLSAVFGLNELCAELVHLVDMPKFKEAYLDYCRYFNATKAEQTARYGTNFGTLLLFQGHSRLDAYAAVQTGDPALAKRAWAKFYNSDGYTESAPWKTEKLTGPAGLVEGREAAWVSTNDTALYGLAAIENLALLGDRMPAQP
ncbi:hypothetical protein [Streptomyces eurythermus]|uniref:exo-rhamnogalacturonan lyase family protein n=1 Tax=Streptomyces eurythermus TaxID=42237 RepID=UPI0033D3A0BD